MSSLFINIFKKDYMDFYLAKVKDIDDPKKLNRVKVQVLGLHSDEIIKDDLPWSSMISPISTNGNIGKGSTVHGLAVDSIVMGKFFDHHQQTFVIFGSLVGQDDVTDPDNPVSHVNRLARNEEIEETIVQTKKDGVITGVETAVGNTFDEPETDYDSIYPHNKVFESSSGHIIEIDDTEGKERLHTYHKTGTFEEIQADGKRVVKVVGDDFEFTLKDKNLSVKGNLNITTDGNTNIYAKGTTNLKTETANVDSKNINLGGQGSQNDSLAVQSLLDEAMNNFKSAMTGVIVGANSGGPATISPQFTQAIVSLVSDVAKATSKDKTTKLSFGK